MVFFSIFELTEGLLLSHIDCMNKNEIFLLNHFVVADYALFLLSARFFSNTLINYFGDLP